MEQTFQANARAKSPITHIPLARGIGWGLIGGLSGTLVMDLVLMAALSVAGLPALACFSIVGDTVGRFFSLLGLESAGGIPLGVAAHYVVGPLVGAIFGAAAARSSALRSASLGKSLLFAVLYVEIISQPILAAAPLLLKMTAAEIVQWYVGSFLMHFLFGVILGAVVSRSSR